MPSGASPQEAGGGDHVHQFLGDLLLILVVHQLVAGQLFRQETVVGSVAVQGPDHVVAIAPGVGADLVFVDDSFRIAVPGQVEPVLGPALPVGGRVQEPVQEPLVGPRLPVLQVVQDFLRRGGHPRQVEIGPAQQHQWLALGREAQTLGLQLRQQKEVDGIAGPLRMEDLGQSRPPGGAKGPEILVFGCQKGFRHGFRLRRVDPGPGQNPLPEDFHLSRCRRPNLVQGRHLLGDDPGKDQTPSRVAGDERRPRFAAAEPAGAGPQIQSRLLLGLSVTVDAVHLEDGQHVLLGVEHPGGVRGLSVDPEPDGPDLFLGQVDVPRRHGARDQLGDQQAPVGGSRHQGGARLPPGQHGLESVQVEFPLGRGAAVALQTALLEDGKDVFLEIGVTGHGGLEADAEDQAGQERHTEGA